MRTVRTYMNLSAQNRLPNVIHLGFGVGRGKGGAAERSIIGLRSVAARESLSGERQCPLAWKSAGLPKRTPVEAIRTHTSKSEAGRLASIPAQTHLEDRGRLFGPKIHMPDKVLAVPSNCLHAAMISVELELE